MDENQKPTAQVPVNPLPPMQEVPVSPTVNQGATSFSPEQTTSPIAPKVVTLQPPPVPEASVNSTENIPPQSNKPKAILYILVAVVLIITLFALGFIFFNFLKTEEAAKTANIIPEVTIPQPTISPFAEDSETEKLKTQGTSDEVVDIEKDLKNTDFTNIDKEIGSISSQLSGSD